MFNLKWIFGRNIQTNISVFYEVANPYVIGHDRVNIVNHLLLAVVFIGGVHNLLDVVYFLVGTGLSQGFP